MKSLVPRFIQSIEDFRRVVIMGSTTESLLLEFKRDMDAWQSSEKEPRRRAQKELARDLSAFANAYGGCLIVGVDEVRLGGHCVAHGVHSLDEFEGRRKWIEQAISNWLVPSTMSCQIVPLALPEGNVLVANVPASRDLVVVYDRQEHTSQFCRRTNEGKDWMNPDEALRLSLDPSRARKLAFLRASEQVTSGNIVLASGLSRLVQPAPNMQNYLSRVSGARFSRGAVSEHEVELRVSYQGASGPTCVNVPFGLIREAWLTADGKLGLFLDVKLVLVDSEIVLE